MFCIFSQLSFKEAREHIMQIKHFVHFTRTWYHDAENKIASAWLLGLLLGAWISAYAGKLDSFQMLPGFFTGSSFSGLVSVSILPFLIVAYAASTGHVSVLPLICFFRAFLFSFCGSTVFHSYGSAGWLIRLLFAFSDICSMPVFYWFTLRCCRHKGSSGKELLACILFVMLFVCINHFVISPFWAGII